MHSWSTGYEIERRADRVTSWLGDGVDMFFDVDDTPLRAGSDAFNQAMQSWTDTDDDIDNACFGGV